MNSTLNNDQDGSKECITLGNRKVTVETFTSLTDNQRERMINGKQKHQTDWSKFETA